MRCMDSEKFLFRMGSKERCKQLFPKCECDLIALKVFGKNKV